MNQLRELFSNLSDLQGLIKWAGYFGMTGIIFAETGLLIGFFLPGDSLLVTAGLLASQGKLNIAAILVGTALASIIGAEAGYFIGVRIGPTLFRRPDSGSSNESTSRNPRPTSPATAARP